MNDTRAQTRKGKVGNKQKPKKFIGAFAIRLVIYLGALKAKKNNPLWEFATVWLVSSSNKLILPCCLTNLTTEVR